MSKIVFLVESISVECESENHLGVALIQPVDYVIVIIKVVFLKQLGWNRGNNMLSSLFFSEGIGSFFVF